MNMSNRPTENRRAKKFFQWSAAAALSAALLAGCGKKQEPPPAEPEPQAAERSVPQHPGFVQPAPAPRTASSAGNDASYQALVQKRNERFAAQDAANAAAAAELAAAETRLNPPVSIEDTPLPGDQIMVDVSVLTNLFPGLSLEQVTRTQPLAIGDLLKQRGVEITTYQQLREMGITNYTIIRAPQAEQAQDAPPPQ